METEQFSLCWNQFQNNLTSGFQALFKDEDLVDVTLAAEGRYIKAHKVVLSVCSPYFKELFQANPCKHPIVILHDMNYSALNSLLQFMYNGEVSVSQEEIPVFLRIAEVLKVKGLTDNANLTSNASSTDSNLNGIPNKQNTVQPSTGSPDAPLVKRMKTEKRIIKPIQHLKPLKYPESESPTPTCSSPMQPPIKQQRLEEQKTGYTEPLLKPKQEPVDHSEDDDYMEHSNYVDKLDLQAAIDSSVGETSDSSMSLNNSHQLKSDASSPGTLQCILGKRGLPRLIVDGYTFFKKSTYKNKCFWYCKTNRIYKCPAVCWTVNGRIVKWPEAHTHEIVPEVINPGEDSVVPIEMLRQVLIDAAR